MCIAVLKVFLIGWWWDRTHPKNFKKNRCSFGYSKSWVWITQRKTRFGPYRNFFRMKCVSDTYFGCLWDGDSNMVPPEGGLRRVYWVDISQRAPSRGCWTGLPLPPPLYVLGSLNHTNIFLMHSAHPSQVKWFPMPILNTPLAGRHQDRLCLVFLCCCCCFSKIMRAIVAKIFYITTPLSKHSPLLNSESITALLMLLSLSCNSL